MPLVDDVATTRYHRLPAVTAIALPLPPWQTYAHITRTSYTAHVKSAGGRISRQYQIFRYRRRRKKQTSDLLHTRYTSRIKWHTTYLLYPGIEGLFSCKSSSKLFNRAYARKKDWLCKDWRHSTNYCCCPLFSF